MAQLVCPDYRLTLQQKHRIQNSLKFVLMSPWSEARRRSGEELFGVFMKWFDGKHRLVGDPVFYLLDCIFSLPLDLSSKDGHLESLISFAIEHMEDEDEKIQIAAVRVLKVLTQAVTPESACYRLACERRKRSIRRRSHSSSCSTGSLQICAFDTSRQRESCTDMTWLAISSLKT